jgi:uncharacterized membrane protein
VTLAPLLAEPVAIQVHAFAALGALALGIVQLAAPKGTRRHRVMGWAWVGLMTIIVITSLAIHEIRLLGPWSPIHLLSILTAILLPIRRAARPAPLGEKPSRGDDQPVCRSARHRRGFHPPPRPGHARSRLRWMRLRTSSRQLGDQRRMVAILSVPACL